MMIFTEHTDNATKRNFSGASLAQRRNSSVSTGLVKSLRERILNTAVDVRYVWDAENRMKSIGNAVDATYKYDALGRRVQKTIVDNSVTTTTTFVCGGAQVFTEYVNTVEKQSYVYATYVDDAVALIKANGTTSFYHCNHLYSTEVMTDNLGNIVETSDYNSYGKVTLRDSSNNIIANSSVDNEYYFTGRRLDAESGLYYFRFRCFDVELGRFISRDMLNSGRSMGGYHDGYGLYIAYFIPVAVDPFGLRTDVPWDAYWIQFQADHPGLTKEQLEWAKKQLARGCVGVTCANLGARENHSDCFKTKAQATLRKVEMELNGECPKKCEVYSIHIWNDTGSDGTDPDVTFDPDSGDADLDNWDQGGRPAGAWNGGDGGVNFDYGFMNANGTITHADMYHNPDLNGDGVGDFYPNLAIRDSTIYISSETEWGQSYADFNEEVWCVQCSGDSK